jgi:hypothetical protein
VKDVLQKLLADGTRPGGICVNSQPAERTVRARAGRKMIVTWLGRETANQAPLLTQGIEITVLRQVAACYPRLQTAMVR